MLSRPEPYFYSVNKAQDTPAIKELTYLHDFANTALFILKFGLTLIKLETNFFGRG